MALNDPYATTAELELRLRGEGAFEPSVALNATELEDAVHSASRGIESVCGRQFNDAGSATARLYRPDSCSLEVDDFHTLLGFVVATDDGGDGTYGTAWLSTDYELHPLNGIVDGQIGWPFNEIVPIGSHTFAQYGRGRASVRVTARWGWATVPKPIKTACLMAAVEIFKLKDTPFGVAGTSEWGTIRVRENPMVMKKLAPYIRTPVLVA